jgi:hypothetical protein
MTPGLRNFRREASRASLDWTAESGRPYMHFASSKAIVGVPVLSSRKWCGSVFSFPFVFVQKTIQLFNDQSEGVSVGVHVSPWWRNRCQPSGSSGSFIESYSAVIWDH